MGKFLNLVWRVPLAVLGGGLGYYGVKYIMLTLLPGFSIYMDAGTITLFGTWAPLAVPAGCMVWAFQEFIFPPKQPRGPTGLIPPGMFK